tara:strand:+ start:1567 stop:1803 length:237 start_codon:yes stop_codon:yes gene_type:complete
MRKLFMKLCGLVRKLRSSQPTLQPMSVKTTLDCDEWDSLFLEINGTMDYYEWMQYLHDELEKEQIITYNNYNERYRNV